MEAGEAVVEEEEVLALEVAQFPANDLSLLSLTILLVKKVIG